MSPKAVHGEKTIEVKLRFWTNNIAETEGDIEPGHCWAFGAVIVPKNSSHGIGGGEPVHFGSLMKMAAAIEQAMIDAGITVHTPAQKKGFFGEYRS